MKAWDSLNWRNKGSSAETTTAIAPCMSAIAFTHLQEGGVWQWGQKNVPCWESTVVKVTFPEQTRLYQTRQRQQWQQQQRWRQDGKTAMKKTAVDLVIIFIHYLCLFLIIFAVLSSYLFIAVSFYFLFLFFAKFLFFDADLGTRHFVRAFASIFEIWRESTKSFYFIILWSVGLKGRFSNYKIFYKNCRFSTRRSPIGGVSRYYLRFFIGERLVSKRIIRIRRPLNLLC